MALARIKEIPQPIKIFLPGGADACADKAQTLIAISISRIAVFGEDFYEPLKLELTPAYRVD